MNLHQIKIELAERSLAHYVRQCWPVVEPGVPYVHGWHIDAICDHLEAVTRGEIRNLIINIPPRHMKSLLTSVFWPTWVWINQPAKRWLFSSYADALALRDSVKCRRIIQSNWYQERWGDVFQLTSDQNQKSRFENDKTGFRLAGGTGGVATGEGGDFIVADDPIKAGDAHSKTVRDGVNEWWSQTMSTRRNDPKTGARVIIMQRLHESDLTGYLLERMQTDGEHYEHLCLPAEYEPTQHVTAIGWSDPRTEPNQLLWPAHVPREALEGLKRDLGSYGAAGQLQQRPAPADGGMLKRSWWRFWYPPGPAPEPVSWRQADGTMFVHEQAELDLDSLSERLQSWDMTFKDTKGSDFVCGQVWGRQGANKYLLAQRLERLDITATIKAVETMTSQWPKARLKLVEDKANGPAVISMLRNKLAGLVAVDPRSSKEARVSAVAPDIEAGNVYLPHPAIAPWVGALMDSAAAFPNAAHDDDIDAMSQALLRWGHGQVMVATA